MSTVFASVRKDSLLEPEALLSVQEAAARLGLTEAAIRYATLDGHLPFVRKRGRSWIEVSQLHAYLARMQATAEATTDGWAQSGSPETL